MDHWMLRKTIKEEKPWPMPRSRNTKGSNGEPTRRVTESMRSESAMSEQRDLLRALEDLTTHERAMYELDNRKDQMMTVFKVALTNLVMWTRDHYFSESFAHATWGGWLPFSTCPV
jgi:hypothetical protein